MAVDKRNIFLESTKDVLPYVSGSKPFKRKFPLRSDPAAHGAFISRKLQECKEQSLSQKQVAAIRYKEGTYLEFSGASEHDLNIKSLENRQQGIRLLTVKNDGDTIKATVYIPAGKESYFLKKVEAYGETVESSTKPKNNDLIRSIENIKLAVLNSFWLGDENDIPEDVPVWCEVWIRYDGPQNSECIGMVESNFKACCEQLNIPVDERRILFPERIVYLIKANKNNLEGLILGCDYIAEIRRAPEPTSFFEESSKAEQTEWINELLSRTNFNDSNTAICLLDTGIKATHPLIHPATEDDFVQSVNSSWGLDDEFNHGTGMAGIAIYNNLSDRLLSRETVFINHKIESVKILSGRSENSPELYGAITAQAVSLAEISNPQANRAVCMAVTSNIYNTNDGSPTSWSAAIDSITSGADGSNEKRLFFISAGNVCEDEYNSVGYTTANKLHVIENPGQAWNAITVGGYSEDVSIDSDEFDGFSAVADVYELSPYSSTSALWNTKWPVKPEILLNAGNMASNGTDYTPCPDLSLLTTNNKTENRFFSTIWGTSSATAQASWMAAQLMNEYPNMWPETVRALMIHSARWSENMQRQFNTDDKKTSGRRNLLRHCGYGIPDLSRAIQCYENSVNMIIQGELQPFEKQTGAQPHMKEMDLHKIPWPTEVLRDMGDIEVELRVTLSYFIEPGPGEIGWKDKYRYPSCGLRFDVINSDEQLDDFKKRINISMRGEDRKDKGEGSSGSSRWYLGSDNRDTGSIHSDFIKANAVDLCDANYIAVYPIIGWWRERNYLGKCNEKIRYSLVISISTPERDADLYTPIISQIPTTVITEIPTP